MAVAGVERAHRASMRGDIEGLRAIAVGYVLLFHIFPSRLGGGFAGVDVFFVISGFLITSQLIREATRTGTVSLTKFYARRARRLLPAATVVLVFTAIGSWLLLPSVRWHDTGLDVIAAALYVVNWALAFRSVDYLAEDSLGSPVQHYWSLSVEEQFYVIWPLLIIVGTLAARKLRLAMRPVLIAVLTIVTASSFGYSIVHTASSPATAYFISTTRIWEMGLGALVAFAVPWATKMSRGASQVLAVAGLVMIGLCGVLVTMSTPWPGYQALLPTLGSASVILAGCNAKPTLASTVLGLRPMVWIGGLSYALYLWHWPLLVFVETRFPQVGTLGLLGVGALSVVVAWLSRHLVEDPIRFHPVLSTRTKHALVMGAIGMALSVAAGLVPLLSVPKESVQSADAVGAMSLVADQTVDTPFAVRTDIKNGVTLSGTVFPDPAVAPQDVPALYADDCQVPEDGTAPIDRCSYGPSDGTVVALVGDSKMGQWLSAIQAIGDKQDWRIDLYLKSSCAFADVPQVLDDAPYPACQDFVRNSLTRLAKADRTPDLVFMSGGDVDPDGSLTPGLEASMRTLQDLGATVIVLADNPSPSRSALEAGTSVYECVSLVDDYSGCDFPANAGNGTAALKQAASKAPGTVFVSLEEWFCPDGKSCPAVIGGVLVYRQGSHITDTYAKSMAPVLSRVLFAEGLVTSVLAPS